VIADIRRRLPQTRILLEGILPADRTPAKRSVDEAVNHYLADQYASAGNVKYVDAGPVFLHADGTLDHGLFLDPEKSPLRKALHPNPEGAGKMGEAIRPVLSRLFADPARRH